MKYLLAVWHIFDERARRAFAAIGVMMAFGAVLEGLGVGLVLPFIVMLGAEDVLGTYPALARLSGLLGLESERQVFAVMAIGLLLVFVLKNAYLIVMHAVKLRVVHDQQVAMQRRLLAATLHEPMSFHVKRHSSESLRNINHEVRQVFLSVLLPGMTVCIEGGVVVAIAVVLMVTTPPVSLLGVLALGGVISIMYARIRERALDEGRRMQGAQADMLRRTQEALGAIKEIKLAGRERFYIDTFAQDATAFARASSAQKLAAATPPHAIEAVGVGGLLAMIALLMSSSVDMREVLPVFGVFAAAMLRTLPSFNRIMRALTLMRHHAPAVEVVRESLARAREVERADERTPALPFTSSIELRDVCFQHVEGGPWVLDGCSLTISRGAYVGLVGSSGAGKTTAIDVMLGLYEPAAGDVLVDGEGIAGRERAWQRNVALIAQPVFVFDDSVRRNVAVGLHDDEIDDERVWRALERARLAEDIRERAGGLSARVGEGGVGLSGGQRQRLGIARALYREPAVLVFDEATSALDRATEREIVRTIHELAGETTVVAIAHRLSTVAGCDEVFFLDGGRVAARGTLEELMNEDERFRSMAGEVARLEEAVNP
ncbi:MAG: ABC transporter ATP-binding protein [Myxococcota bacterium]